MLEVPIYLGRHTYNRRHSGKFQRWTNGSTALELNCDEVQSKNDKADWVRSRRLFEPLVDQKTWDALQRKAESSRPRNGVFQNVLEVSVGRYLEETRRRLELLTGQSDVGDPPTTRLEQEEESRWQAFRFPGEHDWAGAKRTPSSGSRIKTPPSTP